MDDWGTHEDEFDGIVATGSVVEYRIVGAFGIENGVVAEVRLVAAKLGLLQHLGVVDPPTG